MNAELLNLALCRNDLMGDWADRELERDTVAVSDLIQRVSAIAKDRAADRRLHPCASTAVHDSALTEVLLEHQSRGLAWLWLPSDSMTDSLANLVSPLMDAWSDEVFAQHVLPVIVSGFLDTWNRHVAIADTGATNWRVHVSHVFGRKMMRTLETDLWHPLVRRGRWASIRALLHELPMVGLLTKEAQNRGSVYSVCESTAQADARAIAHLTFSETFPGDSRANSWMRLPHVSSLIAAIEFAPIEILAAVFRNDRFIANIHRQTSMVKLNSAERMDLFAQMMQRVWRRHDQLVLNWADLDPVHRDMDAIWLHMKAMETTKSALAKWAVSTFVAIAPANRRAHPVWVRRWMLAIFPHITYAMIPEWELLCTTLIRELVSMDHTHADICLVSCTLLGQLFTSLINKCPPSDLDAGSLRSVIEMHWNLVDSKPGSQTQSISRQTITLPHMRRWVAWAIRHRHVGVMGALLHRPIRQTCLMTRSVVDIVRRPPSEWRFSREHSPRLHPNAMMLMAARFGSRHILRMLAKHWNVDAFEDDPTTGKLRVKSVFRSAPIEIELADADHCAICLDPHVIGTAEGAAGHCSMTPCKHIFCTGCVHRYLRHAATNDSRGAATCPTCRRPITKEQLVRVHLKPTRATIPPPPYRETIAEADADAGALVSRKRRRDLVEPPLEDDEDASDKMTDGNGSEAEFEYSEIESTD